LYRVDELLGHIEMFISLFRHITMEGEDLSTAAEVTTVDCNGNGGRYVDDRRAMAIRPVRFSIPFRSVPLGHCLSSLSCRVSPSHIHRIPQILPLHYRKEPRRASTNSTRLSIRYDTWLQYDIVRWNWKNG